VLDIMDKKISNSPRSTLTDFNYSIGNRIATKVTPELPTHSDFLPTCPQPSTSINKYCIHE
jgi:hypothetical protein